MTGPDPIDHGWWLASRAAGLVALALITASVAVGLAMAAGIGRRSRSTKTLVAIHEQTALAGLIAIAVHGITLLGDPWLHPGIRGVALPFAMDYRPAYTALGIVAGYLAAVLGLSFYARRRIGARLWRRLHRATSAVYALSLVHALGAGTDAGTPWLRTAMLATAAPILGLFVFRVLPRAGAGAARPAPAAGASKRA